VANKCDICGAGARDDRLCRGCANRLTSRLREAPHLLAQLRISIAKQSRLVGSQEGSGHTGGPKPLPLDLGAAKVSEEYEEALVKAARRHGYPRLHGDKDGSRGVITCADYLLTQVPRLRREGGAGVALSLGEIERKADRAWHLIDRPAETWYAGPCPADGCGQDLLAKPGEEYVRCRRCRKRWKVSQQREVLLDAMYDYRARAVWIASVLPPILERTITPQSIYVLVSRGWVTAQGQDAHGNPLYRIGDVYYELEERYRRRMAAMLARRNAGN
jgi:hypothetical protein